MNKCQPRSATSQLFSSGLPCPRQPPPLPAVFTVNCTHTHAHALTCTHMHSHTLSLSLPQECSYTNTTYLHIHAHYCSSSLPNSHSVPSHSHSHSHNTTHTPSQHFARILCHCELQTFNFSFFPFAIFLAFSLSYFLQLPLCSNNLTLSPVSVSPINPFCKAHSLQQQTQIFHQRT